MRLPVESGNRLKRVASRHGWTPSDASARLVEEGLRRSQFAFTDFRDSAAGRQAYIQGSTLAVWEVLLLLRSYREDVSAVAKHLQWPKPRSRPPSTTPRHSPKKSKRRCPKTPPRTLKRSSVCCPEPPGSFPDSKEIPRCSNSFSMSISRRALTKVFAGVDDCSPSSAWRNGRMVSA
jgi:hypothetical protein